MIKKIELNSEVTDRDRDRAIEMLRIAAKYINTHCPDEEIFYDEAECDGWCVVNDCEAAAKMLEGI